jgi:hypothetical protein
MSEIIGGTEDRVYETIRRTRVDKSSEVRLDLRCDKDRGVGIERYVIQIRLSSSSRGEGTVE